MNSDDLEIVENAEPPLFTFLPPRKPRWWAILGSVALHSAGIYLLILASQVSWETRHSPDLSAYRVEMFQMRIPEPLVYEPPPARPAPRPKPNMTRPASNQAKRAPAAPAPEQQQLRKATRGFTAPDTIKLPEQAMKNPNLPVILQPEYRPQAPKTISVPAMAAWGGNFRPTRQFIAPGKKEPQAPAPQFAATPELAMPNRAAAAGNLNLNLPQPELPRMPALPAANASTAPVRTAERVEPRSGAIESVEGDPANLIAITPMRVPAGTIVNVPAGLRNIPPTGDPNGAVTGGAQSGSGDSDSSRAAAGGGSRNSRPDGAAGNGGDRGAGQSGGRPGGAGNSPSASSASGSGSAIGTRVPPAPPAQPVRVTHPANGKFDVVIAQSAARIDLTNLGGSLSGNPVYSVYLAVGGEREWLLEYCLPAGEKPRNNPYEVFVDSPAVIAPPYPVETAIPRTVITAATANNIVFHGFLTPAGAFRGMALRSPEVPLAREILALLAEWRFRPAAKDGRPTEIEVLLVVPGK